VTLSTTAPGARVPRSTADQPPPEAPSSGRRSAVILGPRDRLIGELHIDGDVRLSGTVQGEIHATGDVEIDDEAKVNASLVGSDVSIRGHVSGPVTARKRLVVARSGSLTGDVRVARLVIQDGATFSGNVSMGNQPAMDTTDTMGTGAPEPEAASEAPAAPPSDGKDRPAAGKGKPKR
jgi:cytoskeletal protein CcmA (bactofilin family)